MAKPQSAPQQEQQHVPPLQPCKDKEHPRFTPTGRLLSYKTPAGDSPPTRTKLVQQKSREEWLTAPRLLPALLQGGYKLKISFPRPALTSQELRDFSGPNNAAHSLLSSEAQRHTERPLHWLLLKLSSCETAHASGGEWQEYVARGYREKRVVPSVTAPKHMVDLPSSTKATEATYMDISSKNRVKCTSLTSFPKIILNSSILLNRSNTNMSLNLEQRVNSVTKARSKLTEEISRAKQPQLPQPLLIRLLLQTLHQLRCPSLDTLQHLNVSLVVGGPKLNTEFEVRPHQCRVQGHDHFPGPAGHAIFDTSQDAIGFLDHLGTLLAHVQAAVNQHPQVLFRWAAFQPLFPKPVALHGVAVAQVQDLALGLAEPHTTGLGPSIQPVQVPLQSLPTLEQINTPAQLGVLCKLTEGHTQLGSKKLRETENGARNNKETSSKEQEQSVKPGKELPLAPAPAPLQEGRSTPQSSPGSSSALLGVRLQHIKEKMFGQEMDNRITDSETEVLEGCCKVSLEPSLLQAEPPQLSQPVFIGEVHVLMLGAPELNAVLQVRSHESGVEVEDHLPRPAGHASFDAAQDTRVDHTTQLGVVSKLAEGALSPTVHVADKDVKQCQSQYRPLRNATRHWSPLEHQTIDCTSLSVTIQPIPYPPSGPSVKSTSLQFRDNDVMQDSIKCCAQAQAKAADSSEKLVFLQQAEVYDDFPQTLRWQQQKASSSATVFLKRIGTSTMNLDSLGQATQIPKKKKKKERKKNSKLILLEARATNACGNSNRNSPAAKIAPSKNETVAKDDY
ncbi:hypothetical protein QYF61_027474 [Mycteria americana]|uniref:Uncharacterized protein n=1 Tax=Mycteria americana TaxID=33587 RepID=A0AAN7NJC3_MYCAM|nr:hypothetical protein QYF61_027474 [Mycteria americana]